MKNKSVNCLLLVRSIKSIKMFKLFVVLAFVPAILARTPFQACGDLPVPDSVFFGSLDDPCLQEPCNIVRSSGAGTTYVNFTPKNVATTILPRIRATVFGINFTQELPEDIARDPCSILTLGSCPLPANEAASYALRIPVDPTTPLLTTVTEITLFGDNSEVIFCYRINTRVVA